MRYYPDEITPEDYFADLSAEELCEKIKQDFAKVKAEMIEEELDLNEESIKECLFGYQVNWDEIISEDRHDTYLSKYERY